MSQSDSLRDVCLLEEVDLESLSPPNVRSSKRSGTAIYKNKFNTLWRADFSFITHIPGNSSR